MFFLKFVDAPQEAFATERHASVNDVHVYTGPGRRNERPATGPGVVLLQTGAGESTPDGLAELGADGKFIGS